MRWIRNIFSSIWTGITKGWNWFTSKLSNMFGSNKKPQSPEIKEEETKTPSKQEKKVIETPEIAVDEPLVENGTNGSDYQAEVVTLKREFTPNEYLAFAVDDKSLHEVTRLVKSGVDVNKEIYSWWTPLCAASYSANKDQVNSEPIVKFLLKNGARVNLPNSDGYSPIHLAAHKGNDIIIDTLIKNKADLNLRNKSGMTALHCAAKVYFYAHSGHVEVIKSLVAATAKVNLIDNDKKSPLHYAASNANIKVVNALLEAEEINLHIVDGNGNTALRLATESRGDSAVECSELLIKYIVLRNPELKQPNYILDNVELSEFWNNCQSEVQKMNTSESVLYKFLIANEVQLANRVSSCNLYTHEKLYMNDYPIYSSIIPTMLRNQYDKGVKRKNLLGECHIVMKEKSIR
ncbi:MAG: Phosphocholine transferase AnkX [Wolbachia endosymbiont of Ctenocephalides orientis wCori]|nr:MAG: Phosphocholine transferase AnkX [Wolbachia endosymbiont of Ctenocephalides orientis wCori]